MAKTPEEKHESRIQAFIRTLARKNGYGRKKNFVARTFQKYVRLVEADENGFATCCTCGKRRHYKEVDAGHWQRRANEGVLYDKRNCHVQCKHCNAHLSGNYGEYERFMQANYSDIEIRSILENRSRHKRYTVRDLAGLHAKFLDAQKVELARISDGRPSLLRYTYPSLEEVRF